MFMLLSVLALCFLSEITLFAIFDNAEAFGVLATNINQQTTVRLQQLSKNKPPFDCNNNQNSHTLFRMKQNTKKHRTHAALSKQFKFIIPGICYKAPLK